jgi:hypothetical protein
MLRFLALDLVLHLYIALRLVPALPGGMPVLAVASPPSPHRLRSCLRHDVSWRRRAVRRPTADLRPD